MGAFLVFWCISFIVGVVGNVRNNWHNGYYKYDNTTYYKDGSDWYFYDIDYGDWYETTVPYGYSEENSDPYYMGRSYSSAEQWDVNDEDFFSIKSSDTYQSNHASDDDNDSDYDWGDDDSWDSGGTDWDSDW